jgi:hypothetical protein
MMGERRSGQDALFYEFSLERHIPAEHSPRSIDRFVAIDGVRQELAPLYSEMGRPSIDPELMIRMLTTALASARSGGRRGSPEPRPSLVLSARARRRGAGSLDLLEEPTRPLP